VIDDGARIGTVTQTHVELQGCKPVGKIDKLPDLGLGELTARDIGYREMGIETGDSNLT
jgi:hypothetical protein